MTPAGDRLVSTYRIIALEGGDGVGKTTVAGHLAAAYGYRTMHAAYQAGPIDLRGHYERVLQQPGAFVLDRCFLSEVVYGQLFRGRSRLTTSDVRALATLLRRQHGVLIHLVAAGPDIAARLRARDGSTPPAEQVATIQAHYDRLIGTLHGLVPVLRHQSDDFIG